MLPSVRWQISYERFVIVEITCKIRKLNVSWVRSMGDAELNGLIKSTGLEEITIFGCLLLSEGLLNDRELHTNAEGKLVSFVGSEFN
jgi:hypothetical protein